MTKRPLACAGFAFLITALLASFLPQTVQIWLAAAFGLATMILIAKKSRGYGVLVCAVICVAFVYHVGYTACVVKPVLQIAGQTHSAKGVVCEVANGYTDGVMRGSLKITDIDGVNIRPFYVYSTSLPESEVGARVSFTAAFSKLADDSYRASHYANGEYLSVSEFSDYSHGASGNSPQAFFVNARSAMSAAVQNMLPGDVGRIAAAMCLGDKAALTRAIRTTFNRAGLAHVLVVSGLHLSVICGVVFFSLSFLFQRRTAAICTIFTAVFIMAFIGFTPSIVRAGLAIILVYGGMCLGKQSDAITSLGFAALILCLVNPYAARDFGLLLSFASTLAVVLTNAVCARYTREHIESSRPRRILRRVVVAGLISGSATLATLPILVAMGGGVSLLSVWINLIAIPLLTPIVIAGILLGLVGLLPILEPLARIGGLLCGLCIRLLHGIALWAQSIPGAFVHLTGQVALCVIVLAIAIMWYAAKRGLHRKTIFGAGALFCALSCAIYFIFDAEIVRVALVGNTTNPVMIITQNLRTAVLYRGADSNVDAVLEYLEMRNRTDVDVLVDMRKSKDDAISLSDAFDAKKNIFMQEDLQFGTVIAPFSSDKLRIALRHQSGGNYACVDIDGYTIGVSNGSVDLAGYPFLNVYCAGMTAPKNLNCEKLIVAGATPAWLKIPPPNVLLSDGVGNTIEINVRMGRAAIIKARGDA